MSTRAAGRPGPVLALLAVSLAGNLAGCFGGKNVDEGCDEVAEYQASRTAPALQAPEGLEAPGRASGYVVPPGLEIEIRGAACLARPPPFFRPDSAPAPAGAQNPSATGPVERDPLAQAPPEE